ncbi:MAG: phosphatidylinositol mannoside acyltransferase [Nitriliruptoraceae bacterium]
MTSSADTGPPPPPRVSLRTRVAYARYVALWEAAARLPERLARRLPARAGAWWWRLASDEQRAQVRANLRRVLPDASASELDQGVRDAYVSYARYWLDSFRLHRMDAAAVVRASRGDGLEHVDAIRDSGRGGIFATGHLGSWDVGALFTAQRDWGMVAVAEVVEPRALFDRFVAMRRTAGIDVVPLARGGDVLTTLETRIAAGGLATLLADRDLTRRGPIVEFFGEPCRLPAGAALLARSTGRSVAVGAFFTDGDGYHGVVEDPLDLQAMPVWDGTQAVAHALERLIRRAPEQWHVFVPNWLADRQPNHPVVAAWRNGEDWHALARAERRVYRRQAD